MAQRVVRHRASKAPRQLSTGLVWVEVYLPFDPQAFAEWCALVAANGGNAEVAASANPDLAARALTPIDSHGEAMFAEDVVRLAHSYLAIRAMDVQHDQQARPTLEPVESFINGPEVASPNFWPGAWVIVFRVAAGSPEWAAIEAGQLNAVSFQADVTKVVVRPVYPTTENP